MTWRLPTARFARIGRVTNQHLLPRNLVNRPYFESTEQSPGRTGTLHLVRGDTQHSVQTPILFPVVNLITGTTPNGGGIWRYICSELFRTDKPVFKDIPIMSQVLHFLDYSVNPAQLVKWREHFLHDWYTLYRKSPQHGHNENPKTAFNAPLFLDSGGFKLLFKPELSLAQFGLLQEGKEAESILDLQRDFGGDIVASLDHPLPPTLEPAEAAERMAKSRRNALKAIELLTAGAYPGFTPFYYVACHGLTPETMEEHVRGTLAELVERGLPTSGIGIAIGSLVPLRLASRHVDLVRLIRAAIRGIPEQLRPSVPVHVFGMSGDLIPLLVYLGVDSFDSSTYVQASRTLDYFDPDTHKPIRILEQDSLPPCDCPICKTLNFDKLHETFTARDSYRPQEHGYKSEYYAKVALHNLYVDMQLLERTRTTLNSDNRDDLRAILVDHANHFPRIRQALSFLAEDDDALRPHLRAIFGTLTPNGLSAPAITTPMQLPLPIIRKTISLKHTPDDFNIDRNDPPYTPPGGKDILLFVPCSQSKPYSNSRSHQALERRLRELDPATRARIHKVTISGLYGPVPEGPIYEEDLNVLTYEYMLQATDVEQVSLVANRLRLYLQKHESHFIAILGYATSKAYRTVLQRAAQNTRLRILPTKPGSQLLTEFYRNTNIDELLDAIREVAEGPAGSVPTQSQGAVEL